MAATTDTRSADVAGRSVPARLAAHGVVAGLGLAIGAVVGVVAAFWLGLIELNC